jgi:hypothetical protein
MRPIDKFILHVVHNLVPLNEYNEGIIKRLMDHYREEADDLNINITDEQLKKYIERFDVLKPSIIAKGGTELFKQVGGEKKIEVIVPLSKLIKIVTSSKGAELPGEINLTPDVVYHNDDNTIVIWNGNKEGNCMTYGNGEKWCITRGSWAGHRYKSDYKFPTFYLAKNNNLSDNDPLSFIVIQVRDTPYESDKYVLHNRTNDPHYPEPISFDQLLNQAPWLREIPNLRSILKYQPLSAEETVNKKYKQQSISIREWINLPFETKKQYLVARGGRSDKNMFSDISIQEFISKYLPKYPQLAQFIAITPGIIDSISLLKNLENFNNQDRKSITANIQEPINTKYLSTDDLPFDVKKLLVVLNKWNINNNQRIYVTKDGSTIVLLNLGDNINLGIYTEEDDYPNIRLNKRTSKYLLDYPELDKIPLKNIFKLVEDGVVDQTLLNQILEKAKNDPESAIVAKDTENGTIIIDTNSLSAYRIQGDNISKLPFNDEEVQAVFNEKEDNEGFQQGLMRNLFRGRQDIPNTLDKESLFSIINSTPYSNRTFPTSYSDIPLVVLTTDDDPPKIFTAFSSIQNISGDSIPFTRSTWGYSSNWQTIQQNNSSMTPEELDSYFIYLQNQNQAFTDTQLMRMMKTDTYRLDGRAKKSILTNPNLPLDPANVYVPAENEGTVYLVNTRNPSESAKISDLSGKLVKANIPASKVNRLLRNQPQTQQVAPAPGEDNETPVQQPATQAAPDGVRRRGRPAGVGNAPREPQERQRGNINVPEAFAERGLGNGFTNLPRNDFRKLNVDDAVALNRIGDRGASARDNLLAGQGRVTNVISVGPSKIYFIRLNNDTRIASINIQPGNRNYVIVGGNAYSLNSPRELVTFLRNRNLLETLRTSLVKLHLQENPHILEQMKNLKEEISQEAYTVHAILQTGQQSAQEFINDNDIDVNKLIDYIKQYKGTPREIIIRDIIVGKKGEANFEKFKKEFIKKIKNKNMKINEFKSLVREVVRKKLMENQPAPSRETPSRETETIPDRGTEKDKKRRRIGNPNVEPKPKASMNENEKEVLNKIIDRFKQSKGK